MGVDPRRRRDTVNQRHFFSVRQSRDGVKSEIHAMSKGRCTHSARILSVLYNRRLQPMGDGPVRKVGAVPVQTDCFVVIRAHRARV